MAGGGPLKLQTVVEEKGDTLLVKTAASVESPAHTDERYTLVLFLFAVLGSTSAILTVATSHRQLAPSLATAPINIIS